MKELYREPDLIRMGLLRSILESRGIATWIRYENEYSALGISRLAPPKHQPALCVVNDEDYPRALAALADCLLGGDSAESEERPCPACGEANPGNFERCWNCGGEIRPNPA